MRSYFPGSRALLVTALALVSVRGSALSQDNGEGPGGQQGPKNGVMVRPKVTRVSSWVPDRGKDNAGDPKPEAEEVETDPEHGSIRTFASVELIGGKNHAGGSVVILNGGANYPVPNGAISNSTAQSTSTRGVSRGASAVDETGEDLENGVPKHNSESVTSEVPDGSGNVLTGEGDATSATGPDGRPGSKSTGIGWSTASTPRPGNSPSGTPHSGASTAVKTAAATQTATANSTPGTGAGHQVYGPYGTSTSGGSGPTVRMEIRIRPANAVSAGGSVNVSLSLGGQSVNVPCVLPAGAPVLHGLKSCLDSMASTLNNQLGTPGAVKVTFSAGGINIDGPSPLAIQMTNWASPSVSSPPVTAVRIACPPVP